MCGSVSILRSELEKQRTYVRCALALAKSELYCAKLEKPNAEQRNWKQHLWVSGAPGLARVLGGCRSWDTLVLPRHSQAAGSVARVFAKWPWEPCPACQTLSALQARAVKHFGRCQQEQPEIEKV